MASELKHYIIKVKDKAVLDTLISDIMGWGIKVEHVYRRAFYGFSAPLTSLYIKALNTDIRVEFVEEAVEVAGFIKQYDAPWHLDRVDQQVLPLSDTYTYNSDGTGVIAYVLDSGCVFFNDNKNPSDTANFDHIEFGDRITPINQLDNMGDPIPGLVFDPIYTRLSITDPENSRLSSPRGFDHNGHGTHVAGLIGSDTYGVAKNINIRPVKVLDVFGQGLISDVIAGIEAILADYDTNTSGERAICNMSFGASAPGGMEPSGGFELAVQSMVDAGITTIVAAGNGGEDANNTTPARMNAVITVGATGRVINDSNEVIGDEIAVFSNFGDSESIIAHETFGFTVGIASNTGSAVDIFAPGIGITSTYNTTPTAVNTFSGTSMSSPIVAGVAALILQNNNALTPADVLSVIEANAVNGVIAGIPAGTVNRMLFSTFVDHQILWITPAGDLGEFPEGYTLNPHVKLSALGFSGQQIAYSNPSGGLPSGISINVSTGELDGVAPVVLTDTVYNFDIKVADSSGSETRSFSMTILDGELPPNWLTDRDLSTAEEGDILSTQFVALSRSTPATTVNYSFVDINGNAIALPYGWELSNDGLLTGVIPLVVNDDYLLSFIIRADDGISFSDKEFNLLILQSETSTPPVWITDKNLGTIVSGDSVFIQLLASDQGSGPLPIKYQLEVETGDGSNLGPFASLPQGLILDEDTGIISGEFTGNITDGMIENPTTFDNSTTTFDGDTTTSESDRATFKFQVFAVDGAHIVGKWFELIILDHVENQPIYWVTPSSTIGTATALNFSSFEVVAHDPDNSPNPIFYEHVSGSLPASMFLNSNTGIISGIPSNIEEPEIHSTFGISATDGESTVIRTFAITIQRVNRQPQWITPTGLLLPPINEGLSFAFQLEAIDPNGEDVLRYTIINNSVNPMLMDNSATTFDANTTTFTDSQVSLSELPPGLSLDTVTGVLSGTISNIDENFTFNFVIRVDDSGSNSTNETLFMDREFSIEVLDGELNTNNPPVWITPEGALPDGVEETHYIHELLASDIDGPNSLKFIVVAGDLPNGLALNTNTGVISGFPNDTNTVDDTSIFTVRALDGASLADRTFNITIDDSTVGNSPPVWITASGNIGSFDELTPMVYAMNAIDPNGDNIIFSDLTDSLPLGMTISVDGIITGISPQVVGDTDFNFIIEATDEFGAITPRSFTMTILDIPNLPPVWITDPTLGSFQEGSFIPLILIAVDPDASPLPDVVYTDTSGSPNHLLSVPPGATVGLPLGISISSNGILSGTSNVVVDTLYSFEISASDGAASIPQIFSMSITEVTTVPTDLSSLEVRLTGENRAEFKSWNTPALIFNDELFEPFNPEFGRVIEPEIYIMNSIHELNPSVIAGAFGSHHKRFDVLGGITDYAVVRDALGAVVYEVIYVNIVDPQAESSFDINGDYLENGNALDNSVSSKNFDHLRTELQTLPQSEILPDWMRSEQILNDETSILGYIPAMELAYVKPGLGISIIERLNAIESHIEILPTNETVFDLNLSTGTIFEPIVTPGPLGDKLIIQNGNNAPVEIEFTAPGTLLQVIQDIEDALIDGISATSLLKELFVPDVPLTTWPGEFQTGEVLAITFDEEFVLFSGTAASLLGLPAEGKETSWNDETTFDNANTSTLIVTKGPGYQYTGRKIIVDRYLFKDNEAELSFFTSFDGGLMTLDGNTTIFDGEAGISKWLKFASDIEVPLWITPHIISGVYHASDVISLELEAESRIDNGILSYSLIYGSLPLGLSLNEITGVISGTIIDRDNDSNYFVIRIIDINNYYADRGFSFGGETTFDGNTTTFDADSMTLDIA